MKSKKKNYLLMSSKFLPQSNCLKIHSDPSNDIDHSKHSEHKEGVEGPPLFFHFDEISNSLQNSELTHKMIVYPGNYSDTVFRIARSRGFLQVFYYKLKVDKQEYDTDVDFIWKPTQFTSLVN